MKKNINFIMKYKMEDLLSMTFRMFQKIWKDSVKISVLFILPGALAYGFSFIYFFNFFLKYITKINQNPGDIRILINFLTAYGLLFLGMIIYILLYTYVSSVISYKSFKKAHNEDIDIKECAITVFKEKFGRIFLQGLLKTLIIIGIEIIFIILIAICTFFISYSTINILMLLKIMMILTIILLSIGFIAVIFWLSYSLIFSKEAILYDNLGVIDSLGKSFNLVKKNWWRVFGITYLFNLMMSFLANMIISPLLIFAILPIYIKIITGLINNKIDEISNIFSNMFFYIAIIYGVMILIQSVIIALFNPVFKSLFYLDLKVRKGELEEAVKDIANDVKEEIIAT